MPEAPEHLAVVGASREGRPILAERFGREGPVALVVCGIHGDEPSSVAFGERIRARLLEGWPAADSIQVVLVQVANPDGVAERTRSNAAGVDLNRNFPASNFEDDGDGGESPESEPETRALANLVRVLDPDLLLAIHCCEPLFDWDGPGREVAEVMSGAMPDDVAFRAERLGPASGSLGSWAGEDSERPVVTVEFACHDETDVRRQLEAVEGATAAAFDWLADGAETRRVVRFGDAAATDIDASPTAHLHQLSGGTAVRLDRRGDADRRLLLASIADPEDRSALHVAESLRRRLLHADRLPASLVCATGVPYDATSLGDMLRAVEPAVVVAVTGADCDGFALHRFADLAPDGVAGDLRRLEGSTALPSARVCGEHDVPLLRLGVASDHADGRAAGDVPSAERYERVVRLALREMDATR